MGDLQELAQMLRDNPMYLVALVGILGSVLWAIVRLWWKVNTSNPDAVKLKQAIASGLTVGLGYIVADCASNGLSNVNWPRAILGAILAGWVAKAVHSDAKKLLPKKSNGATT